MKIRNIGLSVAVLFLSAVLVSPALCAPTGYGSPRAKEASAAEPAQSQPAPEAAAKEESGERIGWFGAFRLKMLAKKYDIDYETAKKLHAVEKEGKAKKKDLYRQRDQLLADLDALLSSGNADPRELEKKRDEIKTIAINLAVVENTTVDKVWELLGPEKGARWLLSRQGFFQKLGSSVKKSLKKSEETSSEKESSAPSHGAKTGY
ncbi:MAG: hypothetical protein D6679_05700 [Candidatus Hydrogenedentota bacterium]|nr:MAG: hypothetical protein D6679_05700 [Candidatus Hydrogenedentota bacterium]